MNFFKQISVALVLGGAVCIPVTNAGQTTENEVILLPLSEKDPFESFNRAMFSFNEGLDTVVLKPLAKSYRYVTPDLVESGVTNFFDNLTEVRNIANNLLQFKFDGAALSFSRFVFNSTFGLAGFIDVATPMGIAKHPEDFGQTLGYWGVSSGPYLVLPLFGPSSLRDATRFVVDAPLDPINHLDDDSARLAVQGVRVIDTRAQLLSQERLIEGDKYLFVRNAYLQRREYQVQDGQVPDQFDVDF